MPADVTADHADASAAWRRALKELLADKQCFDSWRKQRYAFAHRVGTLLTEAHPPAPAATGPALYGVYLPGTGLCYVGHKPRRPGEGCGISQSERVIIWP